MRTTLLSDAHISGLDDPNQRRLVRFLAEWPTDELVLAGDIFDVWWGWPRAVYSAYVPILAALREAVDRGTRVVFLWGNHDFKAGPVLEEELGIAVSETWERDHGGQRYVALHGHRAHRSLGERGYQALLRSKPAAAVMHAMGPGLGWRLSRSLVDRSRQQGHAELLWVLEAQRVLAGTLLSQGADVVLMGHSHAPGTQVLPNGTWINLGDWVDHYTFAVIDDEGHRLLRWTEDGAEAVDGIPRRRVTG